MNSLVHLALDLVDEMCEAGLSLSIGALNAICHACEESCEFILVILKVFFSFHFCLNRFVGSIQ